MSVSVQGRNIQSREEGERETETETERERERGGGGELFGPVHVWYLFREETE